MRSAAFVSVIVLAVAACGAVPSVATPTFVAMPSIVAASPLPVSSTSAGTTTSAPRPIPSAGATERAPVFGEEPTGRAEVAIVTRVVDGDTIRVAIEGIGYTLRYIGIDTPETVHPGQPVERMGKEASAANAALVEGRTVVLEKDVSETDPFGRLLRYVWLQDGADWLLVNLELLRLGFAAVTTYPPDVKYVDALFLPAQAAAREAGVGLWAPEATAPSATPVPTQAGVATPRPTPLALKPPTANCDPSYPGVCIPPAPPDLDCGDISFRRFQVRPPDPHRFDGDHDGLGCESG